MSDEVEMADEQNGLNHVGRLLSSLLQDASPAGPSTGHDYASINVNGGGTNHFGDTITVDYNHTAGRSSQAEKYKNLLKSLTFERMDARRANITTALPKTCQWVFTHPHFLAWEGPNQNIDHRGFLWLKGKPGCGKSTIVKLICARASRMYTNEIILTYFFNARAPGILEKSSLGLYRSLTYQLLTALPGAQIIFMTRFYNKESKGKVEEWTTAELKDFLIAIFTETTTPPISIFADALDEGAESDVRDMIAFLESLQFHAHAEGIPLRICVSSRHYPHITIRAGLEIVVEYQTGHGMDMLHYIRFNLHGDQSASMDELRGRVYQKSAGVFLWVVLVVPILNTVFDQGKSLDEASRCLEDIPAELDALLANILARSDEDIDQCASLLQWVIFAMRPLTPEELYMAMRYSDISDPVGPVKLSDHNHVKKYLLHCSRGLVEVTKSHPAQMQFIHETVRGFLLGERGLVRIKLQLNAGLEGLGHNKLTNACLRYIMNVKPSGFHERPQPPLLNYSSTHLFSHADAAQRCGQSQLRFMTMMNEDRNDAFTKFKRCYNDFRKIEGSRSTLNITPLHYIAKQGLVHLAQCFVQHGASVKALWGGEGTPLHIALDKGHLQMAQLLLDRVADINATDRFGTTLLHVASEHRYLEIVRLLLDRGADINKAQGYGETPLHTATGRGHLEIVQLLLDRGVDINATDMFGTTSLHVALDWDNFEIVRLLLDRGADVNVTRGSGGTSLHIVSRQGNLEIMRLLLDRGADINAVDTYGNTSLHTASRYGHPEIVRLLLDRGADIDV